MSFVELARSLCATIGVPIADDTSSPLEIRINELAVTLTEIRRADHAELVLSAPLGIVSPENELGVYRVMLDANVFWTATADCTLGVNAQTREAFVCYRAPLKELDGRRLADMLDTFVFVAGNWANFVEGTQATRAADAPDAERAVLFRA